jgi:2-methylaconitate cis-trans-isomerase PrpF
MAAADEAGRDEALIGAIGASDLLQVDGVGGGSTLTSKVAIVSKSSQPGCDVDYLFAQVGVGQKSVDTRPTAETCCRASARSRSSRGSCAAQDGETTVACSTSTPLAHRRDGADARPARQLRRRDRASTGGRARPQRSAEFLDAWGAVTGSLFPTGRRVDLIDGLEGDLHRRRDALVIMRAQRPRA